MRTWHLFRSGVYVRMKFKCDGTVRIQLNTMLHNMGKTRQSKKKVRSTCDRFHCADMLAIFRDPTIETELQFKALMKQVGELKIGDTKDTVLCSWVGIELVTLILMKQSRPNILFFFSILVHCSRGIDDSTL